MQEPSKSYQSEWRCCHTHKNNIENHQVNLQTYIEAITVSLQLQTQICICNIYLPDSRKVPNLILLNNGSPTRHNAANGNLSAIDLSIASTTIAPIIEWNILTDYNGSEHWSIQLQLLHQPSKTDPINKWKLKFR